MKTMEGNYDSIQFETRAEIGEVIQALKEWKDVHKNDSKMETIQELIDRLDIIMILCQEKVQIKNDFFPSCQHT